MTSIALILLAFSVRDDAGDRELARRIKQNDADAFRAFYEKYQSPLLSFLMSKGLGRDDAEDLIQNAFLVIWDKREEIKTDRSLKSFLFTIAYNRALNFFRDRKSVEPDYAFRLVDSGQNPAEMTASNQVMLEFQKAVEGLPEKRRRVFELCYLQDMSYREASEALSITRKTVENHMAQALKDLRAALKRFMPE